MNVIKLVEVQLTVGRHQMADILCNAIPNVLLFRQPHTEENQIISEEYLQLLDADAFTGEGMPAISELEPYVIRTEKRQAIDYNGKKLFNKRFTEKVEVKYHPKIHRKQQALYNAVTEYVITWF